MTDDAFANLDYWQTIEVALSTIPHESPYYEPAIRSLDHLRTRVIDNHDLRAARVAQLEAEVQRWRECEQPRLDVSYAAQDRVRVLEARQAQIVDEAEYALDEMDKGDDMDAQEALRKIRRLARVLDGDAGGADAGGQA